MQKNVSGQKWTVFAFDRTTLIPTSGDASNITAKIGKDGAAYAATNDVNPTETENGFYEFDLTQAETNADEIIISPTSITSNIQVLGVPSLVNPTPINWGDNIIQTGDAFSLIGLGGSGLNNLGGMSTAMKDEVNTEVDTALSDYDAPTKAEMDAAHGLLATEAKQDIIDGIVDSILVDTNELQSNQGNWVTATGFSTHSASDVWTNGTRTLSSSANIISDSGLINVSAGIIDRVTLVDTTTTNTDMVDISSLATSSAVATVDSIVDTILTDTNDLQTNQGNWVTATGFSTHSASDVSSLILETPANKLVTDSDGYVTTENMRGTDGANTIAPNNDSILLISGIVNNDTFGNSSLSGLINNIPTNPILDTEDGSSFNSIPWNSSWDQEVDSSVSGSLTNYGVSTNTGLNLAKIEILDSGLYNINNLNDISAADLTSSIIDSLYVYTSGEMPQKTPTEFESIAGKIGLLYKMAINQKIQTSGEYKLYNYDADTIDQKSALVDNGSQAVFSGLVTG